MSNLPFDPARGAAHEEKFCCHPAGSGEEPKIGAWQEEKRRGRLWGCSGCSCGVAMGTALPRGRFHGYGGMRGMQERC